MEWLLIAAAVLLGVPAAAWLTQDRLIFYPQPLGSTAHLPPDARPLEVVAADGTRLHGWMRVPERVPAPVVIYFGGNAEEVSWTLADRRWPADWAVAAVNYRGYGRSEGRPGEAALAADALAVHDAVVARPDADARRIVVFGRSLGTGVAIRLAAERPVSGAILASPYDSLVELGRTHFPLLPVAWLLRHRFDVIAQARQLDIPLLAIVAADDTIIPQQRSRALYEAWAGPRQWLSVDGTDHNTLSVPAEFWSAVARFLDERGAEPRSRPPASAIGADGALGAAGRR